MQTRQEALETNARARKFAEFIRSKKDKRTIFSTMVVARMSGNDTAFTTIAGLIKELKHQNKHATKEGLRELYNDLIRDRIIGVAGGQVFIIEEKHIERVLANMYYENDDDVIEGWLLEEEMIPTGDSNAIQK